MGVKSIIDTVSIMKSVLISGQGAKYKRLASIIEEKIQEGVIEGGAKLPPHRIMADQLGVTIGTVSRTYAELERMGLVIARVGDGTFVRKRDLANVRDMGFRNFVDDEPDQYDMSRNMHIPSTETTILAKSLTELTRNPQILHKLTHYTSEAGLVRYRQAGASWLVYDDFSPHADQIICTNGGQHGLLCTLMALLRAGDTIVTEQLTYPGLITAARMLGIKLLGAVIDEEGITSESIDELCQRHRVSAIYCTPTLQNPTTGVLSTSRREAIVEVCRKHNLLIIEDEALAVLIENRPPPLSSFAPERSILISSLSKAVAAGLRIGYLHVPTALVGRITAAVRASCWMATPLAMELATDWVEKGIAKELLRLQIVEISRRKELVKCTLEGLQYRTKPQCPHFWLEVPEPWRASDIDADLKLKNYLIATAEAFAIGREAVPQFVRVSVTNTSPGDQLLLDAFQVLVNSLNQGSN